MKYTEVPFKSLRIAKDLTRTSRSKVFEEHLTASILEIGLAEPIKVARTRDGKYVVVDGVMRVQAITAIRNQHPDRFNRIPALLLPFGERYETRFQTDIYQDLLPSQLATLVEHLHESSQINKKDIAKFIGVSSATLRNYTGLWRLIQRGGLFKRIVELMDHGVLPASNPYAWLRLTAAGLRHALEKSFTGGLKAEDWMDAQLLLPRDETSGRFPIKFVEAATDALPSDCYRQDSQVRALKRDLGLRRAIKHPGESKKSVDDAVSHLNRVVRRTTDPVVKTAARSMRDFLK
jgi:hypothetical protein